jgi:hypothetical protein
VCPLEYTLTVSSGNDYSSVPGIVSFDASTRDIVFESTDNADIGDYQIRAVATFTDAPSTSAYVEFTYGVVPDCSADIPFFTGTLTDQTYTIGDSALTYAFDEFSAAQSECSEMTYTFTVEESGTDVTTELSAVISLDSDTRTFTF